MFQNQRVRDLELSNARMLERIEELSLEIRQLRSACTMRMAAQNGVVEWDNLRSYNHQTVTAIEIIQQLMERQKLTVEAVPASPASFIVTKANA